MSAEKFMKLVEEFGGFEFYQAYRDDIDHIIGGKGDTYWFIVAKEGKPKETYVGKCVAGVWTDCLIKGRGSKKTEKATASGSTMKKIVKAAYLAQDEKWVRDRRIRVIDDAHPYYHYVNGFGDKACDVSEKYGVTIGYNDISDVSKGFHLRYLYTGKDVDKP